MYATHHASALTEIQDLVDAWHNGIWQMGDLRAKADCTTAAATQSGRASEIKQHRC